MSKSSGPTPRASNRSAGGGPAPSPGGGVGLSTSMIAAVNDAAETARLVMDQGLRRAERRGADDDGGSDGDDDGSEHSLHSQTTKTSGNAFGLGIDLTDGDYEDGMEFPITPRNGAGDDETGFAVDGDGAAGSPAASRRRSSATSGSAFGSGSGSGPSAHDGSTTGSSSSPSSLAGGPGTGPMTYSHFASPPPGAFANIPPMGALDGTGSDVAGGGDGAAASPGPGSSDSSLLGRGFEVTNHYEVSAAISAALASSEFGEESKFGGYDPVRSASHPGAGAGGGGVGGANGGRRHSGPRGGTQPSSAARAGSKSAGLPTPEEARLQMMANRSSFTSVDSNVLARVRADLAAGGVAGRSPSDSLGALSEDGGAGAGDGPAVPPSAASPSAVVVSSMPPLSVPAGRRRTSDLVSSSSDGGSVRSDNESNTSSVYDLGSDISPISMSTSGGGTAGSSSKSPTSHGGEGGGGRGKGTEAKGGDGGVLGNLARQRMMVGNNKMMNVTGHSSVTADDEYDSDESDGSAGVGGRRRGPAERDGAGEATAPPAPLAGTDAARASGVAPPHRPPGSDPDASAPAPSTPGGTAVPPPSHRAGLFESFDRNWVQAAGRAASSSSGEFDAGEVMDWSRLALASFVGVFGPVGGVRGDNGCDGEGGAGGDWWTPSSGRGSAGTDVPPTAQDRDDDSPAPVPRAVARALLRTLLVRSGVPSGRVGAAADAVEDMLVTDLCYLASVESEDGTSCLRLSLGCYGEYGRHVIRRHGLSGEVGGWHAALAGALSAALEEGDGDGPAVEVRRYAVQSLPRHTAAGIAGVVDDAGEDRLAIDPSGGGPDVRSRLFEELLCDRSFIRSRLRLLDGRGGRDGGGGGGGGDRNLLLATHSHIRDMMWCASLGSDGCGGENGAAPGDARPRDDQSPPRNSSVADSLNAMSILAQELIALYGTLHDSGRITVSHGGGGGNANSVEVERAKERHGQLFKLISNCNDGDTIKSDGEGCVEVALSLLANDDAWTAKDNSRHVFRRELSGKSSSATPRPSRKKRTQPSSSSSTALSSVLSIDIDDLRTAVSIARSLLEVASFSRRVHDGTDGAGVTRKQARSLKSLLRMEQTTCLKNAIEILSVAARTLCYITSGALDRLDEDDLDDSVNTSGLTPALLLRRFAANRESSKSLLSVTGVLCADCWFSLGKMDVSAHTLLFSCERALVILNHSRSASLNKQASDLLSGSLMAPLEQYRSFLLANINHQMGVYLYEQGDFERASAQLGTASRLRRQRLDCMRDRAEDGEADVPSLLSRLYGEVMGGLSRAAPASMPEKDFTDLVAYSVRYCTRQLPKDSIELGELELCLSLTLEYSALVQHAVQNYQEAMGYFQEALILRTMHVGKNSLDVGSLHFNMGVVYDDLQRFDQAVSRYHESLRIRLDHLNNSSGSGNDDLEESVLLTLKCLGHVYKQSSDYDNSVACYVKVLQIMNQRFHQLRGEADRFDQQGLRLPIAVPVPTYIFEEMKGSKESPGNNSWKSHFQSMNKKELCHHFEPRTQPKKGMSKLKKELIKIHSHIVDLIHEKKQHSWDNQSVSSTRSTRSRLASSSLLLSSLKCSIKSGDVFEAALMRSSFALGKMRLEQMRYDDAAGSLETALRAKWVLDPASSSDSDSEASYRSLTSRKPPMRSTDEDDPGEGQIYYGLGVTNAALDDHERAVRCFLTALRYLRRTSVDSLEIARTLFDAATSYYYLCNFEQAISLWEECLRILSKYETPTKNDGVDGDTSAAKEALSPKDSSTKSSNYRRGVVLYCLVLAKSAIGFDNETSSLLNNAQTLLSSCNDKVILAYMEFMTGMFLSHAASQVPTRLRSITKISPAGVTLNEGLSWKDMCKSSLTLFEQVKNECWFDPMESLEDTEEVRHLPLSGHLCFKTGEVYELTGSAESALNSYMDAANFYRIACGDDNMYVASVLHRMGLVCSGTEDSEYHALGYFNESLSIRKSLLGGNDLLVADTLYASAVVLSRLNRYEASMERYHEALRIQMAASQDSNEVARTLSGMGMCHCSHRAFSLALTCFEGSVKIRKYRVTKLSDSGDVIDLYSEEVTLATELFNLGNVQMQLGDFSQAMGNMIQSRDLRWRHVGGGSIDKIIEQFSSDTTVDEDELLGLAHCLHNIGVMFDIRADHARSLPHYQESLAIKNVVAGLEGEDLSTADKLNPSESHKFVLQSLTKDVKNPRAVNKATLSASVTHQKIAFVYMKENNYEKALFHYAHALRLQRLVLGKDHFRTGYLLSSMGNAMRKSSKHSESAIICYNESIRISKLRFGQNHAVVARALYDIGSLHDSKRNFSKAMHYYHRALSIYKEKYAQNLRQRFCFGFDRASTVRELIGTSSDEMEILSSGDEIIVSSSAESPESKIREQYSLVTTALQNARRQDLLRKGKRVNCDRDDWWIAFEVFIFRLVEMVSTYVVDPVQNAARRTVEHSRRRIDSAAHHAIITAADAIDYQFLLLLQE